MTTNLQHDRQRRTLLVVLILNGLLFAGLGLGGLLADSSALLANALDNASDSVVYLISFLAVGRALTWKRRAATTSGVLLLIFAAGVLIDAGRRWWLGAEPIGWTMIGLAVVAAVVNLICLRLLQEHGAPHGDGLLRRDQVRGAFPGPGPGPRSRVGFARRRPHAGHAPN